MKGLRIWKIVGLVALLFVSLLLDSAASALDEMVNAKDGSLLLRIPGGTFTMGSKYGDSDEKPPHTVTVGPFWLGKYEVTNAQFRQFVKATGYKSIGRWEETATKYGEQSPVTCQWADVVAFCDWADLRLPTEAEWEFAARGPEGRVYPWGFNFSFSNVVWGSYNARLSPVGSKPSGASPCGCLDMAGNVWEWTSSRYRPYPYNAGDGREAAGGSDARVVRGGSWCCTERDRFRTFTREEGTRTWCVDLGFRVAKSQ